MTDDKTFDEALAERIKVLSGTDVFVSLYHDAMAEFERNPWPAIELTIAILLDKPIVVAALPGRVVPPKLRPIADEVIEADGPEDLHRRLSAYLGRKP